MSMMGSYWEYRRTRMRMKRPELAFMEMLLFSRAGKDEERKSPIAAMRDLYKLGKYQSEHAIDVVTDKAQELFAKGRKSMIDRSQRLNDAEWRKIEEAADDGNDRSEFTGDPETSGGPGRPTTGTDVALVDGERVRDEHEGKTSRMNRENTGTNLARPGMRIRFTPDRPENRVESNHVGPERQVPFNPDSRALDGPESKDASTMIEGPAKRSHKEIKGPVKSTALESPEASEKRRATVTDIKDAPSLRSGEAAADRGAAKAREIAQKRAAQKRGQAPRQDQDER